METGSRIIYISLILFDEILAKESRVSSQFLESGRRNPPTVMLSSCGSYSTAPGCGVIFEASGGRGVAVTPHWPIAATVTRAHTFCSPGGAVSLEWGSFPGGARLS